MEVYRKEMKLKNPENSAELVRGWRRRAPHLQSQIQMMANVVRTPQQK